MGSTVRWVGAKSDPTWSRGIYPLIARINAGPKHFPAGAYNGAENARLYSDCRYSGRRALQPGPRPAGRIWHSRRKSSRQA